MIQILGTINNDLKSVIKECFSHHAIAIEFIDKNNIRKGRIISLDKESTCLLSELKLHFYNWDLLFSVLGPNDNAGNLKFKIFERIKILKSVIELKSRPIADELHGSIRVSDLATSTKFYTWLFGHEPKEWTHRYVTFNRTDIKFNFVLLVADKHKLNHDTLYHLGMGVKTSAKVVEFYYSAIENGFHIEKPPRTTWRGTPLHELWLKDPDGTLIEIYAKLTSEELKLMPKDKEPVFLVSND